MACLTNYTVQCRDETSGKVGCFLFDITHWQETGRFRAISPVCADLVEFYQSTTPDQRKSAYIERT